jgi:lipoprotein-anchoring transpeptidase ErfK/SrfK
MYAFGLLGALACSGLMIGCGETVPHDLVDAVESVDRDLMQAHAAELSPSDYSRFAHQWMTLKARVEAEEDAIRWPWEESDLEAALRLIYQEGRETVARVTAQRDTLRRSAEVQLSSIEEHARLLTLQVSAIDSRFVLGRKPVESDLLIKQARTFFNEGKYGQSLLASQEAEQSLSAQKILLGRVLGRYANRTRIGEWQQMAKQTIEWSRTHRDTAIVVNKADRSLTLYKSGKKVLSYPVRLGFNGIGEKRYQGDGATPEGQYRVSDKRGQGQTQFYRALVLNYPNADDRRRFLSDRKAGRIPRSRAIGGQIEIHGSENALMALTLGCVMLDNEQMAALYDRVGQGTPVTIVGALDERNSVAMTLVHLGMDSDET